MRREGRRSFALALAAAATLLVGGCGERSPEDTVSQLYRAAADEDYEKACDLLGEDAAQAAAEGAESCESGTAAALAAGGTELLDQIEVGEATIDGDSGTVAISAGDQEDTVDVVKEDGEWKVDDGS